MRILLLITCLIVIGSQAFNLTPHAHSQGFDYELGGVIYEQPAYFLIDDDNYLNPDNEFLQFSDWVNRFYGRITFNLKHKDAKFISQFRPTILSEEGHTDADLITDDAYLDVDLGGGYFLYVGKRNIRDVIAYGTNPTDFLGENKKIDFTKREEERRIERKGNYLIGVDAFLKNIFLSAIYAPKIDDWQEEKDRVLLRGTYFAESINTDMSLHLFNGDIPGIGFDMSSTVSDNLVLHTESAFRWGSEKQEIAVVNGVSDSAPRIFKFELRDIDDSHKVYPYIVVGGSYTFTDGTNLICEYIYNGDGYSNSEWDDLTDFIKSNNDAYRSNFFTGLTAGNLGQANDIMKFREMRRNYIFLRLSNSTLIEKLDGQLVFQLSLDDLSFLTFPTIDYKVGTNTVLGLSSTMFFGEDDSEFGMMYWHADVSLLLKYYF